VNPDVTGERAASVLTLKDGRRLGYAEFGDPQGEPLLFFHGMPGSRLEGELAGPAAKKLGVRVIATDRPGYGLSDFVLRRAFLDWPADVIALADALGIGRFAVAGVSGGGPYVAACALKIPERLTAAGIIAGVSSFDVPDATEGMSRQNRLLFGLARRAPWLARLPMWAMSKGAGSERLVRQMTRAMPEVDRATIRRSEVWEVFKRDAAESFRQGAHGAAWELVLYSRPWGFRLEEITMEVHLWQGELDKNVPPSMGRYQAHAIPNCRATFYPGEGHISLVVDHMEEILGALMSQS